MELGRGGALQADLPRGELLRFCTDIGAPLREQVERMEKRGTPLGSLFEIRDGISTGFKPCPDRLLGRMENGEFVAGDGTRMTFDPRGHRKIIDGTEFQGFTPVAWAGRYIDYDKKHEHTPPHPGKPFNCQLRDGFLYDRSEKVLTRQTARGLIATVDRERYFVRNSVHVTFQKPLYAGLSLDALCACLNTKFYTAYLLAVTGENGIVFPQVHIADLRNLPVCEELLAAGGPLATLGAEILALHRQENKAAAEIEARVAEAEALVAGAF